MNAENCYWQKLRKKNIKKAENLLRENEYFYTSACGRFISGVQINTPVWTFLNKSKEIKAMLINSKSTLLPVLNGIEEIDDMNFLKKFIKRKNIHSVQGLTNEVMLLENILKDMGMVTDDIFDYDLMNLDNITPIKTFSSKSEGIILRNPLMTDLDALAPLQEGYEKEEVLPKSGTFHPASSRLNIANIIAGKKILVAELNGKLVGKINVSSVSFTRYLVGGIYVHPEFRGRGIAKRMTYKFISSIFSKDTGVSLFVKKNNYPAKKIYEDIGFKKIGDYRITYY